MQDTVNSENSSLQKLHIDFYIPPVNTKTGGIFLFTKKKLFLSVFGYTLASLILFAAICVGFLLSERKSESAELSANGKESMQSKGSFTLLTLFNTDDNIYITYTTLNFSGDTVNVIPMPSGIRLEIDGEIGDAKYFFDLGGEKLLFDTLADNGFPADDYLYFDKKSLAHVINCLSGIQFDVKYKSFGLPYGMQTMTGDTSVKYIEFLFTRESAKTATVVNGRTVCEFLTQKLISDNRYTLTEIYLYCVNYGKCSLSREQFGNMESEIKKLFEGPCAVGLYELNGEYKICGKKNYFFPDNSDFFRLKTIH